jgi:5'(3')-deoxyribonucleotidase
MSNLRRVVIGVDLDGTIADIQTEWLRRHNLAYGGNLTHDEWTEHFGFNSTISEEEREAHRLQLTPDLYDHATPIDSSQEVLADLSEIPGVELECITASPLWDAHLFQAAKAVWIKQNFPIFGDRIIFSNDKVGHGHDILIDDGPHNLAVTDAIPVLHLQPWNLNFPCRYVFSHWKELRSLIPNIVDSIRANEAEIV